MIDQVVEIPADIYQGCDFLTERGHRRTTPSCRLVKLGELETLLRKYTFLPHISCVSDTSGCERNSVIRRTLNERLGICGVVASVENKLLIPLGFLLVSAPLRLRVKKERKKKSYSQFFGVGQLWRSSRDLPCTLKETHGNFIPFYSWFVDFRLLPVLLFACGFCSGSAEEAIQDFGFGVG